MAAETLTQLSRRILDLIEHGVADNGAMTLEDGDQLANAAQDLAERVLDAIGVPYDADT